MLFNSRIWCTSRSSIKFAYFFTITLDGRALCPLRIRHICSSEVFWSDRRPLFRGLCVGQEGMYGENVCGEETCTCSIGEESRFVRDVAKKWNKISQAAKRSQIMAKKATHKGACFMAHLAMATAHIQANHRRLWDLLCEYNKNLLSVNRVVRTGATTVNKTHWNTLCRE